MQMKSVTRILPLKDYSAKLSIKNSKKYVSVRVKLIQQNYNSKNEINEFNTVEVAPYQMIRND